MSDAHAVLHTLLRGTSCTTCSGPLDEHAHRCLWVRSDGAVARHLVCSTCFASALGSPEKARELYARAELALSPAEGTA